MAVTFGATDSDLYNIKRGHGSLGGVVQRGPRRAPDPLLEIYQAFVSTPNKPLVPPDRRPGPAPRTGPPDRPPGPAPPDRSPRTGPLLGGSSASYKIKEEFAPV